VKIPQESISQIYERGSLEHLHLGSGEVFSGVSHVGKKSSSKSSVILPHFAGVIKWDLCWGDQYGNFEGFSLIMVHCLGWFHVMIPVCPGVPAQ